MNKFKIDKLRYSVSLKMVDGSQIDGNIFLDLYSPIHQGREIVKDLLESEKTFFPLEVGEDKAIIFVNKVCMVKAMLKERDSLDDLSLGEQKPVKITLIDGDVLSGKINLAMPTERVRVSDYLNLLPKWIYLYRDDQDAIINVDHIKAVQPLP
jgi:hypothetical protein